MGICEHELLELIIRPTLLQIGQCSGPAETVLMQAAHASDFGFHLGQGQEQGLGLYRIAACQHRSLWDTYLVKQPDLASTVRGLASQREFLVHPDEELITNLSYATAIAWLLIQQYLEQNALSLEKIYPAQLLNAVFNRANRHVAA